MSDLARLPSYPSPTTLIARSGIQFLDFGFDATKLRVREWGFHDAKSAESVDDLVQLDFDEAHGQYEVVEGGRRRLQEAMAASPEDASHLRHRRELALAQLLAGDVPEAVRTATKMVEEAEQVSRRIVREAEKAKGAKG